MKRKLRMGMVGGGRGAFIGAVHRMAAQLDGQIELVCGAFSSDAARARASGRDLFLPRDRVYASWQDMMVAEQRLPTGDRMDFVSIVTPNHLHFPVALEAMLHGFHVVCDKPLAVNLSEAQVLAALAKKAGVRFALTHNYTGYPMVKEARELARSGALGTLRKVIVEYPQGWLGSAVERSGQKQASWRTDPRRAGASCCIGDIGTHAENLAEYITGLRISEVCADLATFVKGRRLDDDGSVLLRFRGGARGVLMASQVSTGEENALAIRVYGTRGAIAWRQQEPNTLLVRWADRPAELRRAGMGYAGRAAQAATRLPAGHPEGYIEAFANIYRNFSRAVAADLERRRPPRDAMDFPTVEDGVRGMAFIEAVVRSAASDRKWIKVP